MRSGWLLLLLAPVFVGGCAVSTSGACQADADCLDGAKCVEGVCQGGEVPTASFTAPASVALGAMVSLDGSQSARASGGNEGLVYRWSVIQPADVALSSTSTVATTFPAAQPHATYRVQLQVVDQGTPSVAITRDIKVDNSKPVAKIKADPEAFPRNTTINLSAAESTDPDRDTLSYQWTLSKDPATAAGTLTPGTAGAATLQTGSEAVTYTIQVTVSDGTLSDSATLVQKIENQPPTLTPDSLLLNVDHTCTGAAGSKTCSAEGTLNATITDPDGTVDTSSIAWKLKSAPPASHAVPTLTPTGNDGATASFKLTTDGADPIAGTYEFELSAKDNDGATATKTVQVVVGNHEPTLVLAPTSPLNVNHSYVTATDEFLATVALTPTLEDADNDDTTLSFDQLSPTLAGARAELTAPGDGTATYKIYVAKANPASLIDGTNALYTISAAAADVNGGHASAQLPIVVQNRPPTSPTATVATPAAGHSYGNISGVTGGPFFYKTYALSYGVSDPDGDPLSSTWTVDGQNATAGGTLTAPTVTVYASSVAVTAATFTARSNVKDSFGATAGSTANLPAMGNRKPTLTGLTAQSAPGHSYGVQPWAGTTPGYSFDFAIPTLTALDPDGDPLTAGWGATLATAPSLRFQLTGTGTAATRIMLFATEPAAVTAAIPVTLNLNDGSGPTPFSANYTMGNRAPVLNSAKSGPSIVYSGSAAATTCAVCSISSCTTAKTSTQFANNGTPGAYQPPLDALATDPDGDPVTVTWSIKPPSTPGYNILRGNASVTCASGVACPQLTTIGLGNWYIATAACGLRPSQSTSFVEVDALLATPTDSIGLDGAAIGNTIDVRAGCNPACF